MPIQNSAGLHIRPAAVGDAPAMAAVFAAAVMTRALSFYGPRELAAWAAQGSAERFATMLADPDRQLVAAEAGERLVGLAGLEGGEVGLLYAAPEAPAGTGTALLAAVEGLARAQGIAVLTLIASRNALPFYVKRGFAIVKPARRPLASGVSLPVCLMAKTLEP